MKALSRWFVVFVALQRVNTAVGGLAPGWATHPVATRLQRFLQLTNDERAQAEQCRLALDSFRQANPALNETLNTFGQTWVPELEACGAAPQPVDTSGATPTFVSCDVDGLKYEDGALYSAIETACDDAGGILVEYDTTVNCTGEEQGATIVLTTKFTNFPRCMLTEEEEPNCDLEVYGRYISESLAKSGGDNCTATTSIADSSRTETNPPSASTADGGGGGDTPAPQPAPTPPAPTAEDGGAAPTASTNQSDSSRLFGSLVFRSTLLAVALLAFVEI
jgi:hypothetical protein